MWLTFYTLVLCFNGIKPSDSESYSGEIKFFYTTTSYIVESTVLLNDINKRDKEVSFKLNSTLDVYPVWRNGTREYLLKFELQSPQLLGRGTHVNAEYKGLASMWDAYSSTVFYTHYKNGFINEVYLDPSEPHEVLNYKRSLISLFQFNYSDDVRNETDVSGTCEVYYEALSELVLRKVKRRCSWEGEAGGEVQSRRVTRYSLDEAHAPLEVYAEELHELGGALGEGALKARAWVRLRRAPALAAGPPAPAESLPHALAELPPALEPLPLAMLEPAPRARPAPTVPELEALLEETSEALGGAGAGEGGTVDAAAALLRLLPALRAAATPELAALLRTRADNSERLAALCELLGLTGSARALAAVKGELRRGEPPALRYLQGFALAAAPEEAAVTELLKVAEVIGPRPDLVDGALLAAAAGASRLPPAAAHALQGRLLQGLARCPASAARPPPGSPVQEDECLARWLRALGNLRRADTVDLLLQHAERGQGSAAAAALGALDRVPPPALLNATRLRRLERVALGPGPLGLRAAAADLALRRLVRAPAAAAPLLGALRRHAPAQLQRLVWGRLLALAAAHAPVRDLLAALPRRLTGWAARALPGASALHAMDLGGADGWSAGLQTGLLLPGGELRRGVMTLEMMGPDGLLDETLSLEVWAGGPVAQPDAEGGEEPTDEGGGLALAVGGTCLRRRSQTELLELAGAGPVPVLHALRPLPSARAALPLLGAGVLRLERRGALALALDAQVQPSSGSRASAHLHVRGALAAEAEARVAGAWGSLDSRSLVSAAPRLRVSAVGGACGPAVGGACGAAVGGACGPAVGGACVRAQLDRYEVGYEVTLRSELGGERRRVRRRREARRPQQGRSVAGGGGACRLLVDEIELKSAN